MLNKILIKLIQIKMKKENLDKYNLVISVDEYRYDWRNKE